MVRVWRFYFECVRWCGFKFKPIQGKSKNKMTTLSETELLYVLVVQKRKKKTVLFFDFRRSNYLAKKENI